MEIKDLTKKIRQLNILTNKNVSEVFAGNYKSSFKGQGLEVSDIREYNEGDDIRHIDWITTAKQGNPYIKTYEETRELTTIVIIDLSASMNFSTSIRTKKETAIETAAILLFSALKNGDKFGAILFLDNVIYIPPKKGKAHLLRILREIITGFENNTYKQSKPYEAFKLLNSVVTRHSICFYISDEISNEITPLLRISNKKHDFVFLNIYDSFEKDISNNHILKVEDPETGEQMYIDFSNEKTQKMYLNLRKQKYEQMKNVLNQNRIDYLDISTEMNIYRELLFFFRKRQLKA